MAANKSTFSSSMQKLTEFFLIDRRDILDIVMFAMLSALVGLSLPLGIQAIVGFFMSGSFSASLILLIALILIGTLLYGMLQIRQMQILQKLKQKIIYKFSHAYIYQINELDLEKTSNYYLPEVSNRFFDVITLQKGYEKLLLDIPLAIIQIAFGLILLSMYHPMFIAFSGLLILILFLIFKYTLHIGYSSGYEASDHKYKVFAWIQEVAKCALSFKFIPSDYYLRTQDKLLKKHLLAKTTQFKIIILQYVSLVGFKVFITALMLILGSVLLINQEINVGQFIAADIVIIAIMNSVEKLILNIDTVYDSLIGLEKVNKLLSLDKEINKDYKLDDKEEWNIEIKHLKYKLKNRDLLNIEELSILPGQTILFKGDSGSGKSVLIKILSLVLTNFEGTILLNNQPILSYCKKWIRSHIGVFLQEKDLIEASIYDNIVLGRDISLKRLERIIDILELQQFFETLPEGYYYEVKKGLNTLPDSIKQKILLARALAKDSKIYLIENPLNFLSKENLKQLLLFLESENKTTLITSYRNIEIGIQFDQIVTLTSKENKI